MIERPRLATTALMVLSATALTSIGLLLMPIPALWDAPWISAVLDLGHLPLFALLTVVGVWASGKPMGATILVGLFAVAIEFAQRRVGRSGDAADLVRSFLGIAMGWMLLGLAWKRRAGRPIHRFLLIGLCLLVWPMIETSPVFLDALAGVHHFPILSDFRSPGEMVRWRPYQALHERISDPKEPGRWALRLQLQPGPSLYSGVRFLPVVRNWTGWTKLVLRFQTTGEPLRLGLTIIDFRAERESSDRFNFSKTYAAGLHEEVISLADVAAAPVGPPLDLTNIRSVALFASRLTSDRTVVLEELRLE